MTRRFTKILIANRGEIACRVIRSARAEGYATVAVYSDADAEALHVAMADEAVHIGASPAVESYLNADKILEAAQRSGAQAIHPGYGFLAENADFARACADAGIQFIGPPAEAIALMGNKAEAKRRMLEAGVPCVPGYDGKSQDDDDLKKEAKAIGFPVLLKAAAGGGGRGMRRVSAASELNEAIAGARSESKNAFGSDELIIEKLVENARHVEIQVMADEHGNCIHLGERDCSVQRRHQKIIEESPCPVMTPELREAMGAAAVQAAQSAGYTNAGTVEFLLDESGDFYFLEMNTRLQVEHPVTEEVTGLDLVALQLAVAQGDPLPLSQEEVTFTGHAIEARIYAEDTTKGFIPQTGTALCWEPPEGAGVRVDHGLTSGTKISPFYDPMIAKVIAHGATREEARARLAAALRNTLLLGVTTNLPLLSDVLECETFVEGNATTAFLESSDLLDQTERDAPAKTQLVAAAVLIEHAASSVACSMRGWSSTGALTVPIKLRHDEETGLVAIAVTGRRYEVTDNEQKISIEVETFGCGRIAWHSEGQHEQARYAIDGVDLYLDYGERVHRFVDATYEPSASSARQGDGTLKAPMAGQIVRLNAAEGDTVAKDDVLVVLEAMKMENQIVAPHDGTIEALAVAVGDQVDANQVLLTVASRDDETEKTNSEVSPES